MKPAKLDRTARQSWLAAAGNVHLPQFLLQLRDLIPDPGGQLELELPRCRQHLVGKFLNQLGEFDASHAFA